MSERNKAEFKDRQLSYTKRSSGKSERSRFQNNKNDREGRNDKQFAYLGEVEQAKLAKRAERFKNTPSKRTEYGFISRGEDTRLQDSQEERERFFNSILSSFIKYCNDNTATTLNKNLHRFIKPNNNSALYHQEESITTIENILMSLRKLREALISRKPDQFTIRVFLFSIRITSMIGHYQTYIPSISFLLKKECYKLLSTAEASEIATLLILHVSHYNRDNSKAIQYYYSYLSKVEETKTLEILKAWVRKDYYNWIRFYNAETDSSKAFIMGFGIKVILEHMISCITRSYFTMGVSDLEYILPNGVTYDHLVEKYRVPWKKNDNMLIIKDRSR